jgi:hypothetical protein
MRKGQKEKQLEICVILLDCDAQTATDKIGKKKKKLQWLLSCLY